MIYFTSDLHLKDDRPHKLFNRRLHEDRTDWDVILKERWNGLIKPDDTVYILGDVGRTHGDVSYIDQLNGRKILIKGNHDNAGDLVYKRYFDEIHGSLILEDVLDVPVHLTHKPINYKKGMFNLVGHVHDVWKHKRNMINVGIENWGLLPLSVAQLNEAIKINQTHLDENDFMFENDYSDESDNPKYKTKDGIAFFGRFEIEDTNSWWNKAFNELIDKSKICLYNTYTETTFNDKLEYKYCVFYLDNTCTQTDIASLVYSCSNPNKEILLTYADVGFCDCSKLDINAIINMCEKMSKNITVYYPSGEDDRIDKIINWLNNIGEKNGI